jgi:5-hydroxyisourate hydrolase
MTRISTHVLDTALGKPAAGVPVLLEHREASGAWQTVGSAETDNDGRCKQLLPESRPFLAGLYRLSFDTSKYFATNKTAGLYPTVQITFEVRPAESDFHIPLLLSPNGYTTYRGS